MRIIDADALTLCNYDLPDMFSFRAVPEETLEAAPTIDAVEVVRCKDCKYKTRMGFCLKLADHECFWNTPADFFCKMGEVKE